MVAQKFTKWLATGLLVLASTSASLAQEAYYSTDHDLQWFSPVDIDFENRALRKSSGYFFNYDKLSWAATGERITVGDNSQVVMSEFIFGSSPYSQGTAPSQYQINNGLQDVPPDAEFGWGERYEFGYYKGGSGWLVGVLDGPKVTSQATYGFEALTIPNTLPLNSRYLNSQDTNLAPGLTPFAGLGSADLSTSRNGFGSVHVNFATPAGYLLGFRDYWASSDPGDGSNIGAQVTGGPSRVFVATTTNTTTGTDANGNPAFNLEITQGAATTGADGVIDDLDGDRLPGFFFVVGDLNGDGTIDADEIIGNGVDYGDLHMFNVRFDSVTIRNVTRTQGVEIMKTHNLSNLHLPVKRQGNQLSIAYGVRYLRLRDSFWFEGKGDLLGRTFAETAAQNSIVGPQIRAIWQHQFTQRMSLGIDGRFLFGYNIQDLDQVGAIGEDLVPGGVNSLASAQPTAFSYGRRENNFSPVAEFRAEGSYQLTSAIALKLGYTATFIDNITRSSQVVRWYLPDMGLLSGGEQDIFINGVNFGVEVVH